mgnify:CR=1 FL=1
MMVKLWDSTREKSPRELDNAGFIPGINVNFSSSSNTTLAVDSTVLLNVKITFRSFFLIGLKGNTVQYTYAFVISRILIR